MENLSPVVQSNWAKLEAERSLYKSGMLQWLILLVAGHYLKVGSTYLSLVWLISPAFACKFNLKKVISLLGQKSSISTDEFLIL